MTSSRKAVLLSAAGLFAIWVVRNMERVLADSNGVILLSLGTALCGLILLRSKDEDEGSPPPEFVPWVGGFGALVALLGIILPVHQLEWLGLVLVLYACLRWSLPDRYARDIILALFLLYWANPLPGQIVGRFQLAMQTLSMNGSERLLHCMNVRVWGDGFVLRSGFAVFGVPAQCSGMRTAMTVLLCALGTGVIFRFKWYEMVVFTVLAVVQSLLLNILRITFMVAWAPRMPEGWAENFLHDTLGIFLLLAIGIVQFEATWWKVFSSRRRRIREGIATGELDAPDKATILPSTWRIIFKWARLVLIVFFLGSVVSFGAYKGKSSHRVAMIKDIIEELIQSDLAAANRAIDECLALSPADVSLFSMKSQVYARQGKFEDALTELSKLENLSISESVRRSWALMALGRADEAIEVVDSLPENARSLPGVAMVRAEYSVLEDKPEEASKYLRRVGSSHLFVTRMRALYSYLATHEQWETIVQVDSQLPYMDVFHALIGLHAYLKTGDVAGAAGALKRGIEKWPDDPRFLGGLFLLAMDRPGTEWDERLTDNFRHNILLLGNDALASYMAYSFRLGRADLAWMAFNRLKAIDPDDPSLHLAVAQYGDFWFTFRKHALGFKDRDVFAVNDIKPLFFLTKNMSLFKPFWARMPIANEIATGLPEEIRSKHLDACLAEMAKRDAAGTLARRLELERPVALMIAGKYKEAHERLAEIEKKYPERRAQVRLQSASLHSRQGEWQEVYEDILVYNEETEYPSLRAGLLQINSLMHLGFGVYAMQVAEDMKLVFPGSTQLDRAISAIWDVFGFKEQALFVLSKSKAGANSRAAIQLLYDTGRFDESRRMSTARGVQVKVSDKPIKQRLIAPPAETAVVKFWRDPLDPAGMAAKAKETRAEAEKSSSPFKRELETLTAKWYASKGTPAASQLDSWLGAGRTDLEKMAAAKRLAMLLARQKRYKEALAATEKAVRLNPRSGILRRIHIVLSDGDHDVVMASAKACPEDPHIWLASFVTRMKKDDSGSWMMKEAKRAAESEVFSVQTMVSAGAYLLRHRKVEPATVLARPVVERARGLISAYALGMRCALANLDSKWALACALNGVEHAVDPSLFYRVIVRVKTTDGDVDSDMIAALEFLKDKFVDQSAWSEMLGGAYFQRGDAGRALSVFSDVMAANVRNVRVQSLLLAAEAARIEGETFKAVDVLEAAHAMYPKKVNILNNLIYNLAKDERTVDRARELLPGLLELAGDSFAILDTAALVHLRAGNVKLADKYMKKALELLKDGDYGELEAKLNADEIVFMLGHYDEAQRQVERIRANPDASQIVDLAARDLLRKIKKKSVSP